MVVPTLMIIHLYSVSHFEESDRWHCEIAGTRVACRNNVIAITYVPCLAMTVADEHSFIISGQLFSSEAAFAYFHAERAKLHGQKHRRISFILPHMPLAMTSQIFACHAALFFRHIYAHYGLYAAARRTFIRCRRRFSLIIILWCSMRVCIVMLFHTHSTALAAPCTRHIRRREARDAGRSSASHSLTPHTISSSPPSCFEYHRFWAHSRTAWFIICKIFQPIYRRSNKAAGRAGRRAPLGQPSISPDFECL